MSSNFVDYGNATALMGGVADRIEKDKFIGTKNDWKQLSSEEKAVYDGRIVNITDDFTPGGGGGGGSYTSGDGIDITNDEISVKTDSSTTFINSSGEVEGLAPDANDFDVNTASKTVALDPSQRVYTGTRAAWDELSTAEKVKYGIAHFTDDLATQGDAIVVDVVETGNLNAVTSNAVSDIINNPYPRGYVEITVASNETYGDALTRLYNAADMSKVSCQSKLIHMYTNGSIEIMTIRNKISNYLRFYSVVESQQGNVTIYNVAPAASNSTAYHMKLTSTGNQITDDATVVITDGRTLRLVY